MEVCIAYYSRFGNGKKCAEYVEETLKKKGHSVELFSVTGVRADSLPEADLYIFSSPTQIGNPPGKIRRFLIGWCGKYSTDASDPYVEDTHRERRKIFRPERGRKDYQCVASNDQSSLAGVQARRISITALRRIGKIQDNTRAIRQAGRDLRRKSFLVRA